METRSYELFFAQVDEATDYQIEKIALNQNEIHDFFAQYKGEQQTEVTGLYGSLSEIQESLLTNFKIKSLDNCTNQDSKIFGIKHKSKMIFCLIFPDVFFTQKPLDEKSIKLTLFRIFCDIVYHIQICFKEEVLQKWYDGDKLPFCVMHAATEIVLDSTKAQPIEEEIGFVKEEYYKHFNSDNIMVQNYIGKCWIKEGDQFKNEFENALYQVAENLIIGKQDELKNHIYSKGNNSNQIDRILQHNAVLKQYDIPKISKFIKQMFANFLKDCKEKEKDEKKFIEKIIKQETAVLMRGMNFYSQILFTFKSFQISVQNDQQGNSEVHFQFESPTTQSITRKSCYNFNSQFFGLSNKQCLPTLSQIFKIKDNSELFIFYDKSKNMSLVYILKKKQAEWNFLLKISDYSNPLFYYLSINHSLYAFNYKSKCICQILLDQNNKISSHKVFEKFQQLHFDVIFNTIIFLSQSKIFILRGNNGQLYSMSDQFESLKTMTLRTSTNQHISLYIYEQLLQCPSGKYFYLSSQQYCDMFDSNFTQIKSFSIQGQLIIIPYQLDIVLLNLGFSNQKSCIIIRNILEGRNIRIAQNSNSEVIGNPGIDIAKGSIVKFGKHNRLQTFEKSPLKFLYINNLQKQSLLKNYLKKIGLNEFQINEYNLPTYNSENIKALEDYIISRVPIQLCTIENQSLIPMINGFRKSLDQNQDIQIHERAELIQLGHLEQLLKELNQNISVVSIMGKQSSGKSYLLNRLFGTRYSVAACRCTNGIWASYASINDQNFLILDCEGLFSSARTSKEEQLMLAFLISISDITMLNQDLTFNRNLTNLLLNLSEASQQLKGDTLFQGTLMIVIRDVSSNDNNYIGKELIDSLIDKNTGNNYNYIEKLFNNKIQMYPLVNNEQPYFEDQIEELRNIIVKKASQNSHWKNGRELIQTIKITLCQLEMFDKTDTSILQQKTDIFQIIQNLKFEWFYDLLQLSGADKETIQNVQKMQQTQEIQDDFIKSLAQLTSEKVNQNYIQKLKEMQPNKEHNKNLNQLNNQLVKVLDEQKQKFQIKFAIKFKQTAVTDDLYQYLQKEKSKFFEFLENQQFPFSFCMQKCQQCFLQCTYFNAHYSNTENKIQQVQNDIEIHQNRLASYMQITKNKKQLIEEYELVNDKIVKLTFAKQNNEIEHKIQDLEVKFNSCIQDEKNTSQFVSEIYQILGNSESFNEIHPKRELLEQLDQLKQNCQKQVKQQIQIQEKLEREQQKQEENSEDEDIKPQSLLQYEELPRECENLIETINQKQLNNSQAIQFFEQELEKIQQEINDKDKEIKRTNGQIEDAKRLLKMEEKQDILNYINCQTKKWQEIQQEMNSLNQLKYKQKNRVKKGKDQQAEQAELEQQIKNLNDKLVDYAVIMNLNNYGSEDQKIAEFLEEQQVQVEELDNKIDLIVKEKEESMHLLQSIQKIIDEKKQIELQKLEKVREINIIRMRIEQEKLQIEKIQLIMELLFQKQNYEEQLNNLLIDQSFNSQQFDDIFDLDQKMQQMMKNQENIEQQIQQVQEKVEIQQKIADLSMQLEEIQTHKVEHSCQRDSHGCEDFCCQCEGAKCKLQAGHSRNHFCEKLQHQCVEKCSISDCLNACIQYNGHNNIHQCNKIHQCDQQCEYCPKKCTQNIFTEHLHVCNDKQCFSKCFHCEALCKQDHTHSQQSNESHFCNKQQHECKNQCEAPGYCTILYDQKIQQYESKLVKQDYQEFVQKGCKLSCVNLIQSGEISHQGKHFCKVDTDKQFHTCESRCPDCNALCIKKYGHQGLHSTQQHRNKDKHCFTQTIDNKKSLNSGKARKFQVGDSAKIENCTQNCERRGRSHFHIIECKGDSECLEKKKISGARHSKEKYVGYEQLNFDEILCSSYWNLKNWEHPLTNDYKKYKIDQCNYFCTVCKGEYKMFCQDKAWHSQSKQLNKHNFACSTTHQKDKFSSINICFVIDSTGSMQKYLNNSILAIKKIVQKSQELNSNDKKLVIKFSAVAYRDHDKKRWTPYKWQNVVEKQNFTDDKTCIKFLNNIKAEGEDDYPEAVLDGLYYGIRMNWSKKSYRILYLIADAPPHGSKGERVYHNFEDDFPEGCPCKLKQTPLLQQMVDMDIKFKIIKLNSNLEMMIQEFQKDYKNLEVFEVSNTSEYLSKIVEDVCDVLENEEITYDESVFDDESNIQ